MNDKLKPCPFCGCKAEYIKQGYLDGEDYGIVKCVLCGATKIIPKVRDEATRDWNRRADNEQSN